MIDGVIVSLQIFSNKEHFCLDIVFEIQHMK